MRRIALLALFALGAAACGPEPSPTPTPTLAAGLAFSPCGEAEAPQGEQQARHKFCAQIEVSETTGFKRVVQILAISDKSSDPIADRRILVYHPGGPGVSAVDAVGADPLAIDLTRYTILTWDGTTASVVPGACGPASSAFGVSRDAATLAEEAGKVVKECLAGFGGPDDVGALAAANELEAIRKAIGVDKFDILAVSYGTAITEQYLRSYGQAVGRAVLDGPIALEVPWAARLQAVGKAQSDGASALVGACATERCQTVGNAATGLTYGELRRVLVAQAPSVGGGNTKLTGTIIDQATLLALRSESYWAPWAAAVDAALGGDGTDLWALGEKEYFDLDRAVFYRSICSDINLPPTFEAFGAPQDQLLWAYTSELAPCNGYPRTPVAVAPVSATAQVLILASPKDPLTPSTLLGSAPELSAMGTVCETDVVGHTNLRDPKFGALALGFLTGTAEALC